MALWYGILNKIYYPQIKKPRPKRSGFFILIRQDTISKQVCSSVGRAAVSKTEDQRFDPFHACQDARLIRKTHKDFLIAEIAQLAERRTCNANVRGSIPLFGSICPNCHWEFDSGVLKI